MRKLIWVESARVAQLGGWGCSECAWGFHDAGPPQGDSIEEMARNFERKRDQEFGVHVCAQHPRPIKRRGS